MGLLSGEKSSTKIAALFASEQQAREMAAAVAADAHLREGQAVVLGPKDSTLKRDEMFGAKVQPENTGIRRTFVRSHLVLGLAGGLIGLALWWALRAHPLIASSSGVALVALVGFGITFGMLLGGLLTLRPDQSALFTTLRDGLGVGQWGVIFHPLRSDEAAAIKASLERRGAAILSSV